MDFSTNALTTEEEEEMKHFFTTYDVDENGMLELDELQKMFANFNVIALKEDIKAFFERVDTDRDGTVDFDELMQYIEEIMAEKSTSDEVVDAFNLIDEDGSGEVSHEEVAVAM
ncbi:uncharacterized protein LOC134823094 [Bolinopsis microptera]|uniref:uncharacterized protein LOC134823094 n=1 Tax=Bolinopsis microptera TaxID=2820187 RepID=UPI003079A617